MRHLLNLPGSLVRSVPLLFVGLVLVACGSDDDAAAPAGTAIGPAPAASTPAPETLEEALWPSLGTARVITDDLNVRAGPGLGFTVLGRLQPGAEVAVSGRASDGRWLALPEIGWTAYDETWVELPVSFDELPMIPPEETNYEFIALHPVGTVIDIPVVDQIVAAVAANDRPAILDLAVDPAAVTSDADEAAGPSDAEDPDGSTAARPPDSACGGNVLPATELEGNPNALLTSSTGAQGPLRLYAVTGAPGADDRDAEFSIVFAFERGEARQVWPSPQGGIAWFTPDCGGLAPGDLLTTDAGADLFFWLRPFAPAPLEPVQ